MMTRYFGPPAAAGVPELVGVAGPVLLAGAMSLGANLAAVQAGRMTPGRAVLDAAVRGTAATMIWRTATEDSSLGPLGTLALLLGAGYAVGVLLPEASADPQTCCDVQRV